MRNSGRNGERANGRLGKLLAWAVAIAVPIAALSSWAVAEPGLAPKEAIAARQSNLKDLGGAFKTIRDQLRVSKPNLSEIKLAAQQIKDLVGDQHHWFPKGTGPESGIETDAKPEIWTDPTGFAAAQKEFGEQAPKLLALASAEDLAGLKSQVGVVGQTCKGCHDKYRVPQQ